jgi:glycosyltransferase involved in cell wall biosynthesis
MKNVIFYTDTPIAGGAEKHMLLLAKNLNRDKYRVTLVCSKYKQLDKWCAQFIACGMPVIRLNVVHKHDPRHMSQLKQIFKTAKPDLLHLHLWNPGSCRYAFMAVNKEIKVIATEHDPFPLKGIKKTIKSSALKKTDHTIAVSDENRELLLKLYPQLKGKISTIHNGMDLENFEKDLLHFSSQDRTKIRQNLFDAQKDDFIILSIAALHPRKGLKYLIQAMTQVLEKSPHTKLVIVGEGPQKKDLEKLKKNLRFDNKVMLLGYQENIPRILKSSDLFVLPSIKEAFGLVLLEAMAAQLPIIATNAGGIPEIMYKNAELVEPGSKDALAAKIIELAGNEPLRQKLAFIGHHHVKNFDAKIMAAKTEELYDKTLL